jgi:ATP-binding protein involved in chromosome partitioning
MSNATRLSDVTRALADFPDPETGLGIGTTDQIHDIRIEGDQLHVVLGLTTYSAVLWQTTRTDVESLLGRSFPQLSSVTVEVAVHRRPPEKLGEIGLAAKSVFVVGSGKGGVGKSTIAAALALGLRRAGSQVGLVDADVYGPSIPHLLGLAGRPEVVGNRIQPIDKDGLRVMSMGLLVPPEQAVVWRGPMLHGAITQFLRDTLWGELDYLVIDMPPGTGDIALTLSQLLPLAGAVVVCTPQEVALLDAVKATNMFKKVNIPILGMVENMSGFVCPDCKKRYDIFGSGGARRGAEELDIPFLGEVPIHIPIRQRGDEGQMAALYDDSAIAPYLTKLTYQLVLNLTASRAAEPPLPSLPVIG